MLKTRKIKVEDLKVGMYILDSNGGWLKQLWPLKRKLITSDQDIKRLLDLGISEVTIDLTRGRDDNAASDGEYGITVETVEEARGMSVEEVSSQVIAPGRHRNAAASILAVERRKRPRTNSNADRLALDDELPRARGAYLKALQASTIFTNNLRTGRRLEFGDIQDKLAHIIDSILRNRNAVISLLKLEKYGEYMYTHPLNVAVLSLTLGRQVGLSRSQLMNLGLGAIFHDIGLTRIPDHIFQKPGGLTDEELELVRKHPTLGVELFLETNTDYPPSVIQVVRHHHERFDGTGYPDGLSGSQISPFMIICGISDVYDALSSERIHKRSILPHEALKVIFRLRDKHFSPSWTVRFIQCLGIYPAGAIVQLNTLEVGVVVEVNHACLTRPLVRVIQDPQGRRLPRKRFLNLSDAGNLEYVITNVLSPDSFGISPRDYFH